MAQAFRTASLVGVLLALAVLSPLGSRASAITTVQIDYSFTVTETFGGFPAPLTVVGVATYDLDAVAIDPLFARYPLLSHTVNFGGTVASAATNTSGFIESEVLVQDQVSFVPPRDRFELFSTFNIQTGGIDVQRIGFTLEGPETIFSGVSLFAPDPTDFTSQVGFVTFETSAGAFAALPGLSELTVTVRPDSVPEPSALLLLVVGVAGLARARRFVQRVP